MQVTYWYWLICQYYTSGHNVFLSDCHARCFSKRCTVVKVCILFRPLHSWSAFFLWQLFTWKRIYIIFGLLIGHKYFCTKCTHQAPKKQQRFYFLISRLIFFFPDSHIVHKLINQSQCLWGNSLSLRQRRLNNGFQAHYLCLSVLFDKWDTNWTVQTVPPTS